MWVVWARVQSGPAGMFSWDIKLVSAEPLVPSNYTSAVTTPSVFVQFSIHISASVQYMLRYPENNIELQRRDNMLGCSIRSSQLIYKNKAGHAIAPPSPSITPIPIPHHHKCTCKCSSSSFFSSRTSPATLYPASRCMQPHTRPAAISF